MTPIEIAYFKHFLFDKDLARSFLHLYKTRHINGSPRTGKGSNPESIEEYFLQTSAKDVIMKAFYFAPTNSNAQQSNHTFDYWKDIDDKWQSYMKDNASNFSNESWPQLRKSFAILRQNWDMARYWRHENLESTAEVYKRMRILLPLPEFQWEHGYVPPYNPRTDAENIKINVHNAQDGDVLVRVHKNDEGVVSRVALLFRELVPYEANGERLYKAMTYCLYGISNKKLHISDENNGYLIVDDNDPHFNYRLAFDAERDLMMDKLAEVGLKWSETDKALVSINEEEPESSECPAVLPQEFPNNPLADFEFIEPLATAGYRLKKNEASLNFNNSCYKLTFSAHVSNIIINSGMSFAKLARNKAGDLCIILNRKDGSRLSKTLLSKGRRSNSVTINSKDVTTTVKTMLGIKTDYSVLTIERLDSSLDYLIYKVKYTKQ